MENFFLILKHKDYYGVNYTCVFYLLILLFFCSHLLSCLSFFVALFSCRVQLESFKHLGSRNDLSSYIFFKNLSFSLFSLYLSIIIPSFLFTKLRTTIAHFLLKICVKVEIIQNYFTLLDYLS